jgi:hypothetical protein
LERDLGALGFGGVDGGAGEVGWVGGCHCCADRDIESSLLVVLGFKYWSDGRLQRFQTDGIGIRFLEEGMRGVW